MREAHESIKWLFGSIRFDEVRQGAGVLLRQMVGMSTYSKRHPKVFDPHVRYMHIIEG